jgi:hypothetical protein
MKTFFLLLATISVFNLSAQNVGLALEGEAWATVKEYPVKGRSSHINQKLTFGPFKTVDINRSWTKGSLATSGLTQGILTDEMYKKIITTDHISKKQTLYFALADSANNRASAYCISQFNAKDFNIGNNPNSVFNLLLDLSGKGGQSTSLFYVMLVNVGTQERWDLLLDNKAGQQTQAYEGYLSKSKDEYYIIKPVNRIKTKKGKTGTMPFGSAGYQITTKEGKPLAAVSLMDKGVVYLTDLNPEEKLLLATALAALLLQEVIG